MTLVKHIAAAAYVALEGWFKFVKIIVKIMSRTWSISSYSERLLTTLWTIDPRASAYALFTS